MGALLSSTAGSLYAMEPYIPAIDSHSHESRSYESSHSHESRSRGSKKRKALPLTTLSPIQTISYPSPDGTGSVVLPSTIFFDYMASLIASGNTEQIKLIFQNPENKHIFSKRFRKSEFNNKFCIPGSMEIKDNDFLIHFAAENGHLEALKILCEELSDVDLKKLEWK